MRAGRIVLDPLRLCVRFKGCSTATEIDDRLCEENGIYCELNEASCITYAIPPFSCPEYARPHAALLHLGEALELVSKEPFHANATESIDSSRLIYSSTPAYLNTKLASLGITESVAVDDRLLGRISGETVCPYPPGIPLLLGKERVRSTLASSCLASPCLAFN